MKTKKKDNTSDVNDRSILNNYLEQLDNEITWVNKNLLSKKNPTAEEKKAMYMIEELLKAYKNGHCAMLLIAIAGIQGIKVELKKKQK